MDNVTNAADEEDLTSINVEGTDVLKFKDKVYNPLVYSGLGRKILRKNIVNGVNTLTQSMINQQNTIYVIQYDFTLGENITVPANCVLKFDGGSISGVHTVTGQNTVIKAPLSKIFDTNVIITGSFVSDAIYPEWFGAKGDYDISTNNGTDNTDAINKAIDIAATCGVAKVLLSSGKYKTNNTINILKGFITIEGNFGSKNEGWGTLSLENLSGIWSNCATAIYINQATTTDKTPNVTIRNLNISNNYLVNNITNAKGIYFVMNNGWGNIIEGCHFQGYDKAIYVDGGIMNYACGWFKVTDCGFLANNICLASAPIVPDWGADVGCTKQYINGLYFMHNRCHGCGAILDTALTWDGGIVQDINAEGQNTLNIDGTANHYNYIFNIELTNRAKFTFDHIYSEANTKYLLNADSKWAPSTVSISNISIELGNEKNGVCKIQGSVFLKDFDTNGGATLVTENLKSIVGYPTQQLHIWGVYNLSSDVLTIPENVDVIVHSGCYIVGKVVLGGNNMIYPYFNALFDTGKAVDWQHSAPATGCQRIMNGKLCFYSGDRDTGDDGWVDTLGNNPSQS